MILALASWVPLTSLSALILALYAIKFFALRLKQPGAAYVVFLSATAVAIPLSWWLSGDSNNPHVTPLGLYFGSPLAILVIPLASFFYDRAALSAGDKVGWSSRTAIELLVLVPVWFLLSVFAQFAIGWVEI